MLALLLFPRLCLADDWELIRDKDGIQVSTRSVEGYSYKAVRSTVVLENTRISSVVALIRNSSECAEWSDSCKSATIIEWVNDQENYVHTVTDLPWPVKDRDVVSHVVWSQNPDTLTVSMSGDATVGRLATSDNIVRVTESHISWDLVPATNGVTTVTLSAHVNPTSVMPKWITNRLIIESPFQTMKGLRSRVQLEKYRQAESDFITEPR